MKLTHKVGFGFFVGLDNKGVMFARNNINNYFFVTMEIV